MYAIDRVISFQLPFDDDLHYNGVTLGAGKKAAFCHQFHCTVGINVACLCQGFVHWVSWVLHKTKYTFDRNVPLCTPSSYEHFTFHHLHLIYIEIIIGKSFSKFFLVKRKKHSPHACMQFEQWWNCNNPYLDWIDSALF